MLHAGGSLVLGPCSFSSHVFFERSFRAFSVERRGLLWDSRFAPARNAAGPGATSIYLVLAGRVTWSPAGASCGEGMLFVATESQLDGESGARGHTLRASGEPFRSLELRIDPSFCLRAAPAEPEVMASSERLRAAAEGVLAKQDTPAMGAFLETLEASGLLRPGARGLLHAAEPEHLVRCWNAVASHFLRFETAPSLQAFADLAGVSLRQMSRDVEALLSTFPIGGDGFREYVTDVRLRWATVLLSARVLRIEQIAEAAGYGSVQALGRAFRDAGLPSPAALRRALFAEPPTA